jgi:hypothetical protein
LEIPPACIHPLHCQTLQSVLQSCLSTGFFAAKTEQIRSNLSHLDLLRSFGDAVSAEMAVNMLKWVMARVAIPAMDLLQLVLQYE